jgi:hypothetical protein
MEYSYEADGETRPTIGQGADCWTKILQVLQTDEGNSFKSPAAYLSIDSIARSTALLAAVSVQSAKPTIDGTCHCTACKRHSLDVTS